MLFMVGNVFFIIHGLITICHCRNYIFTSVFCWLHIILSWLSLTIPCINHVYGNKNRKKAISLTQGRHHVSFEEASLFFH